VLIGGQTVAVWLVSEAVDMRKSIDGLAQAVVDSLHRHPLCQHEVRHLPQ
jgi:transposase